MIRIVTLLALATGALMFAAPAFADTQELIVQPFPASLGAKADTDIDLAIPETEAPTAKIQVYVPAGYTVDLSAAPGKALGNVDATLNAKDLGGTDVQATGTIVVDDPLKYTADPRAQACAAGQHAAVWLLNLTASGQTIQLPVFVDPTTGADTANGAYVLQTCPLSPDVPADQGGALLGAKLADLSLQTTGIFANPATAGMPVWRAYLTSYTAGTATVDPASVIEVRCAVPFPHTITGMKVVFSKATKKVTITGKLVGGTSGRSGVHVRFAASTKPTAASLKAWAIATTDAKGRFTIVKPLKSTLYIFVYVNPYFLTKCDSVSTAPRGCVRQNTAGEYGPFLVIKPKK